MFSKNFFCFIGRVLWYYGNCSCTCLLFFLVTVKLPTIGNSFGVLGDAILGDFEVFVFPDDLSLMIHELIFFFAY